MQTPNTYLCFLSPIFNKTLKFLSSPQGQALGIFICLPGVTMLIKALLLPFLIYILQRWPSLLCWADSWNQSCGLLEGWKGPHLPLLYNPKDTPLGACVAELPGPADRRGAVDSIILAKRNMIPWAQGKAISFPPTGFCLAKGLLPDTSQGFALQRLTNGQLLRAVFSRLGRTLEVHPQLSKQCRFSFCSYLKCPH